MKTSYELKSEKYGSFLIAEQSNKKFIIWWDYYEDGDCPPLEPNFKVWMVECEPIDFSDMPKYGEFKTFNEAKVYLEKKFGKVE